MAGTDHVLKNTNQTTPRISTARPVLIANSARTDGPGSAWRASVAFSTIWPFSFVAEFLIAMAPSFRLALDAAMRFIAAPYGKQRGIWIDVPGRSRPHGLNGTCLRAANQQQRFLRTQVWSMP